MLARICAFLSGGGSRSGTTITMFVPGRRAASARARSRMVYDLGSDPVNAGTGSTPAWRSVDVRA